MATITPSPIASKRAAIPFIMPSKFKSPAGLNQMYSFHYGTVPIVRITGGLDDSVVDITEDEMLADGIKFQEYSSRALAKAIRKALALYQHPKLLRHYRINGMTRFLGTHFGRIRESLRTRPGEVSPDPMKTYRQKGDKFVRLSPMAARRAQMPTEHTISPCIYTLVNRPNSSRFRRKPVIRPAHPSLQIQANESLTRRRVNFHTSTVHRNQFDEVVQCLCSQASTAALSL